MDISGEKREVTSRSISIQVILGVISNFSSLAPSMALGFSAIALPALLNKNNPQILNTSQASWFASIGSIVTPIGCLLSGPILDKFGRKAALLSVNIVCFIGWAIITVAYHMTDYQYTVLLVGRIVTGLSIGLASMPAIVYMAEISSPKLRSSFTTWNAIAFSIGVLIIYALGWFLQENWGIAAAIASSFPCIAIVLMFVYLPESPTWLVSHNRIEEAKSIMCKLHGTKEYNIAISSEIKTMTESLLGSTEIKSNESQFWNNMKYFLKPNCLKPFLLISMYFFFQQCSGIYAIVFYAVDIVQHAKLTIDPYIAICVIAATRTVAAVFVGIVSKRYGRRALSFASGSIMGICMIALAGYLHLLSNSLIPTHLQAPLSWLPLLLLMIYFFASTIGFLTVPFAMAAEVFPAKVRGMATGLVTCIAYIFNFIITKTYPMSMQSIGAANLFIVYGVIALTGTGFLIALLPETKDKTLEEIQKYFGKKGLQKTTKI